MMIKEKSDILDDNVFEEVLIQKEPVDKLISWIIRISLSFVVVSVLFKLMHWPVPMYFVPVLLLALSVSYGLRFFRKTDKKHLDYVKLAFVFLYCSLAIFGEYFYHSLPKPVSYFIWGTIIVLLLYFLSVQGLAYFKNENKTLKMKKLWQWSRFLTFLGFAVLCLSILFKIMHWPFASFMFIGSVIFLITGILTHIRE